MNKVDSLRLNFFTGGISSIPNKDNPLLFCNLAYVKNLKKKQINRITVLKPQYKSLKFPKKQWQWHKITVTEILHILNVDDDNEMMARWSPCKLDSGVDLPWSLSRIGNHLDLRSTCRVGRTSFRKQSSWTQKNKLRYIAGRLPVLSWKPVNHFLRSAMNFLSSSLVRNLAETW